MNKDLPIIKSIESAKFVQIIKKKGPLGTSLGLPLRKKSPFTIKEKGGSVRIRRVASRLVGQASRPLLIVLKVGRMLKRFCPNIASGMASVKAAYHLGFLSNSMYCASFYHIAIISWSYRRAGVLALFPVRYSCRRQVTAAWGKVPKIVHCSGCSLRICMQVFSLRPFLFRRA